MNEKINIMVGGPEALIPYDQVADHRSETWLGVDLGATRLLEHGIVPEYAAGDFDSSTPEQLARVKAAVPKVDIYPPEKDYTDTQIGILLAMKYYQPASITIWGTTGGRLDQLLANLYTPLMEPYRKYLAKIHLVDRQNTVDFYEPGSYVIYKVPEMPYLAFVNLTPVTGLTLPDEKYNLDHFDSPLPISWSSNEFVGTINHFSFDSGIVAVIQSRDVHSQGPFKGVK